jgi:hypothetical protein
LTHEDLKAVSQEGLDAYRSGHRQEHSERCKNAELSELGIIPILCASRERKRLRLSMNTAFEPTYDTDYLYTSSMRTISPSLGDESQVPTWIGMPRSIGHIWEANIITTQKTDSLQVNSAFIATVHSVWIATGADVVMLVLEGEGP